MESLVMMYVYYDTQGNIKSITPVPDKLFEEEFQTATIPLSEVEIFLTGKRNPFDFVVKKINNGIASEFKIIRKDNNISITRSLDNYLTVIDIENEAPIIDIVVRPADKKIVIKLNNVFRELLTIGTEEEQNSVNEFLKNSDSSIYITKENDPYHLLHTITFSPRNLFDNSVLYFDYPVSINLSSCSGFTVKIINSYKFKVKV
jgi:hypothetical protein